MARKTKISSDSAVEGSMKKILAVIVGSVTLFAPLTVNAQDACSSSYIVLPDGKCMNMEYLAILSASRGVKAQMDAKYLRQLDANVTLELSETYRLTETKQERDSRYRGLANTSKLRDQTSVSNQEVEDILYPVHQRAMRRMSEAYIPKR